MTTMGAHTTELRVQDLLFFDNLALFYVLEHTPVRVLGRVMNASDPRLSGSFLGVAPADQRSALHGAMHAENDGDLEKNAAAMDALVIIATDLISRGLVRRQGRHFFGTPREESLQPLS